MHDIFVYVCILIMIIILINIITMIIMIIIIIIKIIIMIITLIIIKFIIIIIIIIFNIIIIMCREHTESASRASGGGLYLATRASKPCQYVSQKGCSGERAARCNLNRRPAHISHVR